MNQRDRSVLKRYCLSIAVALGLLSAAAPWTAAQEEKSAAKAEPAAPESVHTKSDEAKGKAKGHTAAGEKHDAEHAAGGHGDDTDLSHGNATAALDSPADFRFDLSIYTFVVFLILLAVLYKFAWGPIAKALEQREETILRQLEEARLASEKAAQQLKQYEARLAEATDEARQIVSHARKDAEVAKDQIVAEARDAAGKERDRAVADITIAKNHALDEIAQKSVQTAISLASNIIRREVRPQDHEALISEAVKEFSNLN
jgi:F-type H+-transporting ATPase subunit b